MNNIGPSLSTISNATLIVNPIAKQATGLEDTDTKQDIFSAVEETSETSANKASPDSKAPENNVSASSNQNQPEQDQQSQEKSQQEQAIIRELSARDREVRAHEQAHASVGGGNIPVLSALPTNVDPTALAMQSVERFQFQHYPVVMPNPDFRQQSKLSVRR